MADAVVSQRVLDDGTVVIDLRGELDIAVIVNMRHVVFVESTGMGAIVAGYNAAKDAGVRFDVQEVAPFVADQLRATGLYELLIRQ